MTETETTATNVKLLIQPNYFVNLFILFTQAYYVAFQQSNLIGQMLQVIPICNISMRELVATKDICNIPLCCYDNINFT